jgi:REP-associated tyrosine transposase
LPQRMRPDQTLMPRRLRQDKAGRFYHAMNRAVRGTALLNTPDDYATFEGALLQGLQEVPVHLLAYCAMPNHFHLIVSPTEDLQLGAFMHRFEGTHAQRWHAAHGTSGTGAVYQGRYTPVEITSDRQFLTVCRYVERNPKKAGLVARAEQWQWGSLWRRCNNCHSDLRLCDWPIPVPDGWIDLVNAD